MEPARGDRFRWGVPFAVFALTYALCVAPRLRPQSSDTSPGMLGAIVLSCHGDQNLARIPWIDRRARLHTLPYFAAISADGRELVSTFGPAPSVLGRLAYLDLRPGQRVDDFAMRVRARHASAMAVGLAAALCAIALLAWTSGLVAGLGAMVAATSFAGVATMGQGLWQQTAALPFVVGSFAALAWSPKHRGALLVAPASIAVAALIRPADAPLLAALFACWVLAARQRALAGRATLVDPVVAMVLASIAVAPLLVWNMLHLGTMVPNGQWVRNVPAAAGGAVFSLAPGRLLGGVLGLLISPARGLIVFSPIAIAGVVLAFRRSDDALGTVQRRIVVIGMVLVYLVSASFFRWWGGYSFGPRLLTAATWIAITLAFARIETLGRRGRALVVAAALSGSALGLAGLFGFEILQWETPRDPDLHPEVLWNVADNPIRALFSPPIQKRLVPPGPPPVFCPEGKTGRWAVVGD